MRAALTFPDLRMIESNRHQTRRASASVARLLRVALVAAATLAASTAFAQVGTLKEGVNYVVVQPPQPTTAPAGKVEVIEFFGYWCPHCNEFEPTMRDWARRNEAKVAMVYVPVPTAFRASESNLQRLYYALDAMGKEKELRSKVFASIHDTHTLAYNADADAIASWAEKNGIDRKQFVDTFNSFAVQSKVTRANQIAAAYGVTGIPELGVGGKYLVNIDARSIGNADLFVARVASGK